VCLQTQISQGCGAEALLGGHTNGHPQLDNDNMYTTRKSDVRLFLGIKSRSKAFGNR
jgi:hypothetical protein